MGRLCVCYIAELSEKEMSDSECTYTQTLAFVTQILKNYTILYINDTKLLQKNVPLYLVNKDVGKIIALSRRTLR